LLPDASGHYQHAAAAADETLFGIEAAEAIFPVQMVSLGRQTALYNALEIAALIRINDATAPISSPISRRGFA